MKNVFSVVFGFIITIASAQTVLKPDHIFDGNELQDSWVVLSPLKAIH